MSAQALTNLGYVAHDTEVILHDDPEERRLKMLRIPLPEPPPLETIDGYGLPSELQMFQRSEMPRRLKALQDKKGDDGKPQTIEKIYEILNDEPEKYRSEIYWIKQQWKRRLNGYWFFNNGKPTYIDGWHYFFVSAWYVGSDDPTGLPRYRDRDRKWFHACRYFYNHPNFYGVCYPKHRRDGASYRSQCVGYCIVTEGFDREGTIQSMTEGHASEVFDQKLKTPWSKMWFFWKPISKGGTNPARAIEFKADRVMSMGKTYINSGVLALNGSIGYYSSGEKAVDGKKVYFAHQDEVGKKERETFDVVERWKVTRECLGEGGGAHIFGFALLTSTVEEMEKGGGKEFLEIAKNSFHHDVGKSGRTNSGLANVFMPAWEGLSGDYIDEYGNSIIEDPKKPIRNERGQMVSIGAKTFIRNAWEDCIKKEDWAGLASYKRKYPTNFMMCFTKSGKETGFNIEILNNRIDWYEEIGRREMKYGYFAWVNGRRFGKVQFVPNANKPKFVISHEPPMHKRNPIVWNQMMNSFVFTTAPNYVSSSDPMKFEETTTGVKSNGGGTVFRMRDYVVDPDGTPPSEMQSHKFCCTYNNAVNNLNEYLEDMLMMTWYYGAPQYSENNNDKILDFFKNNLCNGLLLYDVDPFGKSAPNAGYHVGSTTKDKIFTLYMNYIDVYGKYEKHGDLLEECRSIQGPSEMTLYDLFASGGGCLLALENRNIKRINDISDNTSSFDVPYSIE